MKYHVVLMEAGYILLGHPWQFDQMVIHNRYTNYFSFVYYEEKITLAPLSPKQVFEDQIKMRKEISFFARGSKIKKAFFSNHSMFLLLHKETCLNSKIDPSSFPTYVISLLPDFENVFLNEELSTTLILSWAALPNKPTYKSNLDETKEIQNQVYDLFSKGYVRERMSPYVVFVL
ncbi:hypothetical protein CR513_38333, partial [Mucuna pruriens]